MDHIGEGVAWQKCWNQVTLVGVPAHVQDDPARRDEGQGFGIGGSIGIVAVQRAGKAALAEFRRQGHRLELRYGNRSIPDHGFPGIAGAQILACTRPVVVFLEMLPDKIGVEAVARLPFEDGSGGPQVTAIHLLPGKGVEVVPVALRPGPGYACCQRVAQGDVEHAACAGGPEAADFRPYLPGEVRGRHGGDEIDHPCGCIAPVERALGAAQHFDPGHVEELGFEQAVTD